MKQFESIFISYRFYRACLVLALVLLWGNLSLSTELLINGSLENYHGLGRPFAWNFQKSKAATISKKASDARSGNHALEFNLTLGSNPEWNSQRYSVQPGDQLRATFYYRCDEAFSNGDIKALIRWWGQKPKHDWAGQVLLIEDLGFVETENWVKVSKVINVPTEVGEAEFHLWSHSETQGPKGRLLLDDFSLKILKEEGSNRTLSPSNGKNNVPFTTQLTWEAQPEDQSYDLYLGTDYAAVESAEAGSSSYRLTIPAGHSRPAYNTTLKPYTQYFWRVDVQQNGFPNKGPIQSFVTHFHFLENITTATKKRMRTRDSEGRGLDTLDVIPDPAGKGYLGFYHSRVNREFELRFATSQDLMTWKYERTLLPNADMPAIKYLTARKGFLLLHEQWGKPGSRSPSNLSLQYYPSRTALFRGKPSKNFLFPLTQARRYGSNLEGTPSFLKVSTSGNRIEVGFHFYNARGGRVDRNARGVLTDFFSDTPTWNSRPWHELNRDFYENGIYANIGDRSTGRIFGQRYMLIEGQFKYGDFGSWRSWYWDPLKSKIFPLYLKTEKGSTAFGNMTWKFLTSPMGKPAVFSSAFIFSEGAGSGEAGQAVWYYEIEPQASHPLPKEGSQAAPLNLTLYWLQAFGTSTQDVYFGTDAQKVKSAQRFSSEFLSTTSKPIWKLKNLKANTQHYWRVDSTIEGRVYKGKVWSFRTAQSNLKK